MSKNTPRILIDLGLLLGLVAVWISFANLGGRPVLLKTPDRAIARAEAMMDALCSADYEGASAVLYGSPDLGLEGIPGTPAGQVIRPLYKTSLSYRLRHDPYMKQNGLAVCVDVRCLDISAMTDLLSRRVMEQPPEQADALETWAGALAAVPQEDYPYVTRTITLNLVYDQDQWWVLPEAEVMSLISGIM